MKMNFRKTCLSLSVVLLTLSSLDLAAQQTDPSLTATVILHTEELKSIHKKRKTTQEKIIAAETAVTLALDRVHSVEDNGIHRIPADAPAVHQCPLKACDPIQTGTPNSPGRRRGCLYVCRHGDGPGRRRRRVWGNGSAD